MKKPTPTPSKRKHSQETILQMKKLYEDGWTFVEIGEKYNCYWLTASKYIRELGVKPRHCTEYYPTRGSSNEILTKEQQKEIVELYSVGTISVTDLSSKFSVNQPVIRRVLKNNNIPLKKIVKEKFTDEQKKQICKEYLDGKPFKEMQKLFSVSFQAIRKVLIENGIKIRTLSEIKLTPVSQETIDLIIKMYAEDHKPTTEIKIVTGLQVDRIKSILKENNVKIRTYK